MSAPRVWTIVDLLRWTAGYLAGKGVPEPRLDAELMLAAVLGLKRLDLYLQFDRPLEAEELARFRAMIQRRAKREPLQYIVGETHFRELTLRVDPRVLIPRSETEVLVEEVLGWARGRRGLRALDVGTGSGAIAISLALEGDFEEVVASDLSRAALDLAAANHAATGAPGRVRFVEGDLLEAVRGERFGLIVSNPPYVGEEERAELEPEVREYEPGLALFSGPGGLDHIRRLAEGAGAALEPGGLLALEIGAGQAAAVVAVLEAAGAFEAARVRRDLAGRDRIVLAERRPA